MKARLAVLPGDGIGPEVTEQTLRVLARIATKFGHDFEIEEGLIGGIAIDKTGDPFPSATQALCEQSDAILLAAVGGPKWDNPNASVRPEQGLLRMRKHFELFANLRPVRTYPALAQQVPLRVDLLEGIDMLFVRELTGGIYFGPRKEMGDSDEAYDTLIYSRREVERVATVAFNAAMGRRRHVTSVDKANVLAAMRLWRKTVVDIHEEYPEVTLEHLLVDACTMHLLTRPASFDVILADNMFGDILSDEASVLAGSLGMLPSASLGAGTFGLYEPVHGSAPDIAGQGKANPVGMLLSVALMLRYSLKLEAEAVALEIAIDAVLNSGARTPDIARHGGTLVSTREFAEAVLSALTD